MHIFDQEQENRLLHNFITSHTWKSRINKRFYLAKKPESGKSIGCHSLVDSTPNPKPLKAHLIKTSFQIFKRVQFVKHVPKWFENERHFVGINRRAEREKTLPRFHQPHVGRKSMSRALSLGCKWLLRTSSRRWGR